MSWIRSYKYILPVLLCFSLSGFLTYPDSGQLPLKMKLSEYGFFEGNMADQKPVNGVLPYSINTPLFSDYAEKLRFIQVPEGKSIPYNDKEVLDFPVGTTLIKTFYYTLDQRKPEKGRRLLETRLFIHEEKGWKALAYHWNEEQTEAVLEVAGGRTKVSWINNSGKKQKLEYAMPDVNQCKGCHSYDGEMRPIGPSARQLNGDFPYADGSANQLEKLAMMGWLKDLPSTEERPRLAVWDDPATGDLDARARAWLEINCAHCHNPKGPASTSGFFLDIHQQNPTVIGVLKTPVAAGRGSGNLDFDIQPGDADASILYYRINSDDPGIMMPELGRKLIHKEGVALVRAWIDAMEK